MEEIFWHFIGVDRLDFLRTNKKMMLYIITHTMSDIDALTECMQSSCGMYQCYHEGIMQYISKLHVPDHVKDHLRELVQRDDYKDYEEIYEICVAYGVEIDTD